MKKINIALLGTACILVVVVLAGCATQMSPMQATPATPSEKLGGFDTVYIRSLTISPPYATSGANIKAAKKINELLQSKLGMVYAGAQAIGENEKVSAGRGRTLLIEPNIKEIKWIGGAARFWVGAMAGSSAINLKVTFTDFSANKVIAEPIFYAKANAYGGAYSMGGTDNAMLARIASDIAEYAKLNQ